MKLCEKYVFVAEGFPYGSCRRMCFHPGPCMLLTEEDPTPPIFDQIVLMAERMEPVIVHKRMSVPNWAEPVHEVFSRKVRILTDQAIEEAWLLDPTRTHDLTVLQHATQLVLRNLLTHIDSTSGVPEPSKLVTPDEPWMAIAVDAVRSKRYRELWDTITEHTDEVLIPGAVERKFKRRYGESHLNRREQAQFMLKPHDGPTLISIFQSSDADSMTTLVAVQGVVIQEPKTP